MRSRHTKYNNHKVTIDGIVFDSRKEGQFYQTLKRWEKEGRIKDLECHPIYELQPRFEVKKKGKIRVHRPITYSPDFRFWDNEEKRLRVVDAKGARTETYLIKKKLFDWKFQGKLYLEETL